MPLQNRVTPTGDIVADPGRGTLMGNRGVLHDAHGRMGARKWRHTSWITCRLSFHDRHRAVMEPGTYTELFFLDEAVALAAGHRPCGECRRERYREFLRLWGEVCSDHAAPTPKEIDRALHAARVDVVTRGQRRHADRLRSLPNGAFVIIVRSPEIPLLVWNQALHPYTAGGYGLPRKRPRDADVEILTPAPVVRLLRAGYVPEVHPSAAL